MIITCENYADPAYADRLSERYAAEDVQALRRYFLRPENIRAYRDALAVVETQIAHVKAEIERQATVVPSAPNENSVIIDANYTVAPLDDNEDEYPR
jgi:transcription elongation GreA/GreB family factor